MKLIHLSLLFCFPMILLAQQPKWLDSINYVYPKKSYESAIGEGKSRTEAEANALGNISRVFGFSVSIDSRASIRYENSILEKKAITDTTINASHQIINCSIAEVWQNPKTEIFYAIAIIPRLETAQMIQQQILSNEIIIEKYMQAAMYEQEPLYKFSLIDLAAITATKNDTLVMQYSILSQQYIQLRFNAQQLQAQARIIAHDITFEIEATEESFMRFALEQTLAELGIQISSENAMYVFKETIIYQGMDTGYGMYILNYRMSIELKDSKGNRLTTFTFQGKEGGKNEDDAKRVLYTRLSNSISAGDTYTNAQSLSVQFNQFLNTLIK